MICTYWQAFKLPLYLVYFVWTQRRPSKHSPAMPQRRVHFDLPARVARQPQDEERSVMRHFMRHIRCCMCCRTSIDSRRAIQLCSRGSEYARDVLWYMYFKHDKAFSLLDWQRGYRDIQIEVPHYYMLLPILFSQYADPSDNLSPSVRSRYQKWKRQKCCVYETNNMGFGGKAKETRFTERVDKHLVNYTTVYIITVQYQ
jgi:hypothetical protein